MLDKALVAVDGRRDHILLEFMAQSKRFTERANYALLVLINRRWPELLAASWKMGFGKMGVDCEDALNFAFLKAYWAAGQFTQKIRGLTADERDEAIRAWLFKITKRQMLDEVRRQRIRTIPLASLPPAPGLATRSCSCGQEFASGSFGLRLAAWA